MELRPNAFLSPMVDLTPHQLALMMGGGREAAERASQERWDDFFMDLAGKIATKSKDRSTKVGAVFVAKGHAVLSCGWNGFPRGVDDNIEARHARPAKYDWMVHAESNAIANAARHGIPLEGSTLYVTLMPCGTRCAGEIVQVGCRRVVTVEPDWTDSHRCATSRHHVAMDILREGGVELCFRGETSPDLSTDQLDLFT